MIFFTTASGAGYGLLALVGLLAPFGALPQNQLFGVLALGLAFAAISAGLLASILHLGQRGRAWRAFSQWRSSWLSREGVAAVGTYVPAGLFAIAWIFFGIVSAGLGAAAAAGAAITVLCTAMIYRSLKPVPRWHNHWVLPNYLALALLSGSLWLSFLVHCFGPYPVAPALALCSAAVAAALKLGYWHAIDTEPPHGTASSATGLGSPGAVWLLEAPHTSENYLLKEMGYRIARKHASKLRRIALVLGFVLPALLSLVPFASAGWPAILAALLASVSASIGIFVERWLFFAEAKHVVTLYYGSSAV